MQAAFDDHHRMVAEHEAEKKEEQRKAEELARTQKAWNTRADQFAWTCPAEVASAVNPHMPVSEKQSSDRLCCLSALRHPHVEDHLEAIPTAYLSLLGERGCCTDRCRYSCAQSIPSPHSAGCSPHSLVDPLWYQALLALNEKSSEYARFIAHKSGSAAQRRERRWHMDPSPFRQTQRHLLTSFFLDEPNGLLPNFASASTSLRRGRSSGPPARQPLYVPSDIADALDFVDLVLVPAVTVLLLMATEGCTKAEAAVILATPPPRGVIEPFAEP